MSYCRCSNTWQKFKECFTGAGETSEGLLTTRTLPLALEAPPAGSWTKALHRYCPVYKPSQGTSYCWRLGTAKSIAVLPKIAVFMFLFLPQEATGDHNDRLWGLAISSQAGWRERMQQLSWVLPFLSILCSASTQNTLKTSIIFK